MKVKTHFGVGLFRPYGAPRGAVSPLAPFLPQQLKVPKPFCNFQLTLVNYGPAYNELNVWLQGTMGKMTTLSGIYYCE